MQELLFNVVNPDGEIVMQVPSGTTFITPEDRERRKKYAILRGEMQADYDYLNHNDFYRVIGEHFTFVGFERLDDMSEEISCKLIYLSTYLNYHGKLMLTQKTAMRKKDLLDVLKISTGKLSEFLSVVCPDFMRLEDDGTITMNQDVFWRGTLKRDKLGNCTKAFIDNVRELYRSVKPNQHKQLGYIFKLLPCLNRKYNVLCYPDPDNVFQTEPEKIKTISFNEFCDLIGYDRKNAYRLKKIYHGIKFKDKDGKEVPFVRIIADDDNRKGKVYVNHKLFYAGDRLENVEWLGTLFS